ncbi:hypothetical protein BH09BAC4_BH09BAC4_18640 [soil metagenome]
MKMPFILGFLFRSILLGSFSGLLACSSVLQATRINRPLAQLPVEMVADAPPESVNEKILFMNNAQLQYAEAVPLSPIPMAPGYQWIFVQKRDSQNSPNTGFWQIGPIN